MYLGTYSALAGCRLATSSVTALIGASTELNGACLFACRADDDWFGHELISIPLFETLTP